MIQQQDIPVGINLLVQPHSYIYLLDTLNFIENLEVSRINLIKLKKSSDGLGDTIFHWQEKNYEKLRVILERFKNKYPEIGLSLDCSLAKTMRSNGLPFLLSKGIDSKYSLKHVIVGKAMAMTTGLLRIGFHSPE